MDNSLLKVRLNEWQFMAMILTIITMISCNNNSNTPVKISQYQDSTDSPKYLEITNKTLDIGETFMIMFIINYYNDPSNITVGQSDRITDSIFQDIYPNNESTKQIGYGLIPYNKNVSKKSLEALSSFIVRNCNTKVDYDCQSKSKSFLITEIYGKNGKVVCVHCDEKFVIKYLESILYWIGQQESGNQFEEIIQGIEFWIKNLKKDA